MGRDQDDNAVKIAYHGCGLKLRPGSSSVKIKKAIQKILEDKRFKQNVRAFQTALKDTPYQHEMIERIESLKVAHYSKKKQYATSDHSDVVPAAGG